MPKHLQISWGVTPVMECLEKIVICEDGRYCLFESIFSQWGEMLSHGLIC
ncbi:hypothetical protein NXW86_08725 [Bacteroides thetaiotaomicron]|nr:hypothetical protein [Bacteroides thetaiotaomicron]MCS2449235.1 hypothetical protein [Bacteroides thetaiotaomicron]